MKIFFCFAVLTAVFMTVRLEELTPQKWKELLTDVLNLSRTLDSTKSGSAEEAKIWKPLDLMLKKIENDFSKGLESNTFEEEDKQYLLNLQNELHHEQGSQRG